MTDELEPTPDNNAEITAKNIEAQKDVEKMKLQSSENLHKGWQEVITNITNAFERSWKYGKESERYNFRNILIIVVLLFIGVGVLTWQKIVPGEVFAFFTGTIIGYLLSMSPLGRPPAK